jgi:hypothetical protein
MPASLPTSTYARKTGLAQRIPGAHAKLQRASARGELSEDGHRLGHVAHVSMDVVVDVGDGIAVSGGVGLGR